MSEASVRPKKELKKYVGGRAVNTPSHGRELRSCLFGSVRRAQIVHR